MAATTQEVTPKNIQQLHEQATMLIPGKLASGTTFEVKGYLGEPEEKRGHFQWLFLTVLINDQPIAYLDAIVYLLDKDEDHPQYTAQIRKNEIGYLTGDASYNMRDYPYLELRKEGGSSAIYVQEKYRRQGIAAVLSQILSETLGGLGIDKIRIDLVNELSLLLVKQFGNYDGVTMKPDEYEEKTFHLTRKFGSNLDNPPQQLRHLQYVAK
jgi:GNAT superfamily N-acetyltransferase